MPKTRTRIGVEKRKMPKAWDKNRGRKEKKENSETGDLQMIADVILDTLKDTAKLLPFLFLTYLVMEYLEHRTGGKTARFVGNAGRLGPLLGAAAGLVPQCGFSAAAASLFSGGVISVGTLLAIFLSTSDEMLPILISEAVHLDVIMKILLAKLAIGAVTGLALDLVFRKSRGKKEKDIHDLCQQEHCHCQEGIWRSALRHTLQIAFFIFLVSLVIGLLIQLVGEEALAGFLNGQPVLGVFLAALIGLIPNCASSVVLTELYLQGALASGQMMAGLLVGAGVGILVLFRTNRRLAENLKITGILYAAGILWGLLIEGIGIVL